MTHYSERQLVVFATITAAVLALIGYGFWLRLGPVPIEDCKSSDLNVTVEEVKQYGSSKCDPQSRWKPMLDWLLTFNVDAEVAAAVARGDRTLLGNCWEPRNGTMCGGKITLTEFGGSEPCQNMDAISEDGSRRRFASDGRAFARWLTISEGRAISDEAADKLEIQHSVIINQSWCQTAARAYADFLVREYNQRIQALSQGQAQ